MITTVSTHTLAIEAYIAKGRLKAEGIPAYISDEYYISANWMLSGALGGVKVQVPTQYLEQAKTIINDLNIGEYEQSLESLPPAKETSACPSCRSKNIQTVSWIWKLAFVSMFLMTTPLPFSKHRLKCGDCGYSWIAKENRAYSVMTQLLAIILVVLFLLSIFSLLYYWVCNPYRCLP